MLYLTPSPAMFDVIKYTEILSNLLITFSYPVLVNVLKFELLSNNNTWAILVDIDQTAPAGAV